MPNYFDVTANQVLAQPVSAYMQGRAMQMAFEQDKLQNQFLKMQVEDYPKQQEFERQKQAAEVMQKERDYMDGQRTKQATALRDSIRSIENSPDPIYEALTLQNAIGGDFGIKPDSSPEQVRSQATMYRKRIEQMAGIAPVEDKYSEADVKVGDTIERRVYRNGIPTGDLAATAPRYRPQTNVTVENQGVAETAAQRKTGEYYGKLYGDLQDKGSTGHEELATYGRLKMLGRGIKSGPVTKNLIMPLAAVAENLGVSVDVEQFKRIGDMQAYQAITREMALRFRNPESGFGMPGAISKFDLEFLSSITPDMANSEFGRALIIQRLEGLAKRKIEIAALARDYEQKNGSLDSGFHDELARFAEENPMYAPYKIGETRKNVEGKVLVFSGDENEGTNGWVTQGQFKKLFSN